MNNWNRFLRIISGAGLKKYKKLPVIICAVLMIIAAAGIIVSFSLPASVESKTNLLSYEQNAKFDYRAFLKPSYLLGPEPEATPTAAPSPSPVPQSALKYPFAGMSEINFSYNYSLDLDQPVQGVASRLIAEARTTDTQGKNVTWNLLTFNEVEGQSLHVQFPLTIQDSFRGQDITVNITVYPALQTDSGLIFESFVQTLTFKVEGALLTVQRNDLEKTQVGKTGPYGYTQTGTLDFAVTLEGISGQDVIEVIPPAVPSPSPVVAPEPPPAKILGPGDVVYTKLVDRIEASLDYHFFGSRDVRNLQEDVTLSAVIKGGDVWSKTLELLPLTRYSGDFSIPFEIDLNRYNQMIENIRSETGVSAESYSLVIRADVYLTGDTDYGKLSEVFSPTLTTNLDKGVLSWTEKMGQSKPGSIQTASMVPNPDRYLGLSIGGLKTLSIILWVFFILCLIILALLNRKFDTSVPSYVSLEEIRIRKKYGEMIVLSTEGRIDEDARIMSLDSIEDLVKVADSLGKPVIHIPENSAPGQVHTYQVYDNGIIYRYELKD